MKGKISDDLREILRDPQGREQFYEAMEGKREYIELSDGTLYSLHNDGYVPMEGKGRISEELERILQDPQGREQLREARNGERDYIELSDGTRYLVTSSMFDLEEPEDESIESRLDS